MQPQEQTHENRRAKRNYRAVPTLRGIIPFSAVTFEVSFLSVITFLPVSVIYHMKAYVVNFQNSHNILIWLPWQRF